MIFAKKLLLSSVFAVGAFGLIACGSDSKSSNPSDPNNPDSPIVIPTQKDANITISNDFSSRLSGDDMVFKGRFGLNLVVDSLENSFDVAFTNIEYQVGKGIDPAAMTNVPVIINSNPIAFPVSTIDLNSNTSAHVSISMNDAGFTECGWYSLIVTVTANNGEKDFKRTEIIPFEREAAEYCREQNPEPEPEPVKNEVAMTACQVELSTNINPGLSLATCTAVPAASAATADIIFAKAGTKSNPEMAASSGTGLMFAPINNGDLPPFNDDYEVDIWPEDMNADRTPPTAYVSDFKFKSTGTSATIASMIENSNQIYVALAPGYNTETGAGFYAFAITETAEGNNGDYTFKVKLYKVQ